MIENVLSISGGKDSTAMLLLAIEQETENMSAVFCDTGHEHQQTYEYVNYLEKVTGVQIVRLKPNFDKQIAKKRDYIKTKWPEKLQKEQGISESEANRICDCALEVLHPTGNPFLDLCLWKGRFPSSQRRFCTQFLKHYPATEYQEKLLENCHALISWQGIRNDESRARAHLGMYDVEFGSWEPEPAGHLIYRPIHKWTAEDVFAKHRKHGIKWNPLYEQGMGRVGCMPCVNANKAELSEIAKRFPEEVERVSEWERLVAQASKWQNSTFFCSTTDPVIATRNNDEISPESHGIKQVMEWAKTGHGGRQYDLIKMAPADKCTSIYGLCE